MKNYISRDLKRCLECIVEFVEMFFVGYGRSQKSVLKFINTMFFKFRYYNMARGVLIFYEIRHIYCSSYKVREFHCQTEETVSEFIYLFILASDQFVNVMFQY